MQSSNSSSFPTSTSPSSIIPPKILDLKPSSILLNSPNLADTRRLSAPPLLLATNSIKSHARSNASPLISRKVTESQAPSKSNEPTAGLTLLGRRLSNWPHSPISTQPIPQTPMMEFSARSLSLLSSGRSFRLQQHESRCLERIHPGVYVAFADDKISFKPPSATHLTTLSSAEELRTFDGQEFTHIVQLVHLAEDTRNWVPPAQRFLLKRAKYLRLTLPPTPPFGSHPFEDYICRNSLSLTDQISDPVALNERARYFYALDSQKESGVHLTVDQFLIARDFLLSSGFKLNDNPARVLITAPRDDRIDAICLVALILARHSIHSISDILAYINEPWERGSSPFRTGRVWKVCLGERWKADLQRLVWMQSP